MWGNRSPAEVWAIILSSWSDVFQKMMDQDFVEKSKQEVATCPVLIELLSGFRCLKEGAEVKQLFLLWSKSQVIEDFSAPCVEGFLRFFYSGILNSSLWRTSTKCQSLCAIATRLQLFTEIVCPAWWTVQPLANRENQMFLGWKLMNLI